MALRIATSDGKSQQRGRIDAKSGLPMVDEVEIDAAWFR
jgi:hypothetical protein